MNLANDDEVIIPGTIGIITAAKGQANLHVSKVGEGASVDIKSRRIALYLGEISKVHNILQCRASGYNLADIVPISRVGNNCNRVKEVKQPSDEKKKPGINYVEDKADWFWK